ncbi:MarR family transcriptional regulator [Companilactobacillus suantsaicola]|uniref:MarR family transcriptional regulator n=2 Tax=Companilactobacillus suantsaicola TaxID=2487723 RepID=A0A4Z0JHU4_9LACO|nr:MarR family transcriptional regulator [Companilactobacillus suantsaicola]
MRNLIMSQITDDLMKQLRYISEAANYFMSQKKQKLTGQQRVLAVLQLEDGLTQNYLTNILDLRPSSVAELMKKMETKNLITRQEDPNDKRSKLVYLTELGKKQALENAALKNASYSEKFLAGLNDEEKTQFSQYLQKISDGWDDDFKQNADKFVDPTDRFKAMMQMRNQMMHADHDLSPEEIAQMRRDMRENMHGMPFGCSPRRSNHHNDFRRDFRFGNGF